VIPPCLFGTFQYSWLLFGELGYIWCHDRGVWAKQDLNSHFDLGLFQLCLQSVENLRKVSPVVHFAKHAFSWNRVLHFKKQFFHCLRPHIHKIVEDSHWAAIFFNEWNWIFNLRNPTQNTWVTDPLIFVNCWLRLETYFFGNLLALRATDRNTSICTWSYGPIALCLRELLRLLSDPAAVHPKSFRKLAPWISLKVAGLMQTLFDNLFLLLYWSYILFDHFINWAYYRRKKVPRVDDTVPIGTSYKNNINKRFLLIESLICSDLSRNGRKYLSAFSFQNISICYWMLIFLLIIMACWSCFFLREVFLDLSSLIDIFKW